MDEIAKTEAKINGKCNRRIINVKNVLKNENNCGMLKGKKVKNGRKQKRNNNTTSNENHE